MHTLPALLELQGIHENLRIIQRDLTAFPPDMSKLDTELKGILKRQESAAKELGEARTKVGLMAADLKLAQRLEEHAKAAVKQSTHKTQYTAAIRELDERERQKTMVARPLKDLETRISALEKETTELEAKRAQVQTQFDELHQIFIAEHENQVAARGVNQTRRLELEAQLEPATLTRFNKLLQQRQGRAVVAVENSTCGGCRTKLRIPLLAELREKGTIPCEFCQRILFLPPKS